MGNHFTSLPAPAPVDLRLLVQVEPPPLLFQDTIGKGRFFKAVSARFVPRDSATGRLAPGESAISMESRVVLKVFLPRERTAASQRRLREAGEQPAALCARLNLRDQPNLLPYQRWGESSRFDAAYLLRQHVTSNLSDRLNNRPYPLCVEKLWQIFQLLRAVEQAHGAGVRHGDVKAENVLVTSWGWLLLTDFALFKPTHLSPADFGFFFEQPGDGVH